MRKTDLCVVGASYAGLACAAAAAASGLSVSVLEAKSEVGVWPHTTGILVPGLGITQVGLACRHPSRTDCRRCRRNGFLIFGNVLFRRLAQLVFFHHRSLLTSERGHALLGKDGL
ncbi:MAG: hypothetical protein RLZZ227_1243 [Pseudomonadota bacterium]|jgi:2-polyprenyl-6-methoxyphenol hydroxylase-like FAD-dependent oxidoreductase